MPAHPLDPPGQLPDALRQHTGFLAVKAGQLAQRLFESSLSSFDLRPPHYDCLATLAQFGPLAQREIAETLGIDSARVVGYLDTLVDRALVVRDVDPDDRRRNQISLTPQGRALTAEISSAAQACQASLTASLSAREARQLRALLAKVLDLG